MRIHLLLLYCVFMCSTLCFSQETIKAETETKIKREETPAVILEALEPLLKTSPKIKYYREKDSSFTFYEVKLKNEGKELSIKFTEDGTFYDLEETVTMKSLPSTVSEKIIGYYTDEFTNYKIKKTQLRYTTALESPLNSYLNGDLSSFVRSYEMEVFIKLESGSKSGLYEFLFSDSGDILDKRKIKSPEADYVLY